jgi:hypothetical protein
MTLRHIVLMRFPDGIDEDFVSRMDRAATEMAKAIPEVQASSHGRDVSGNAENWHYAITYDFADKAAYERYRVHPAHKQFIVDYMRGPKIDKVRIQLNI